MDASAKYQLGIIMQNLKEAKCNYTQLEQSYKDLELLYTKQKERSREQEASRNQLIKLLNEKVEKVDSYKANIENLQIENSNLNVTIQDQNLLIDELSTTIDKLKKENGLLKNKRDEPKNIIERGIKQPGPVKHLNGINGNHFSHPSFDVPTPDAKKKKKKSPLVLQNRYSTLDILGNGTPRKEEGSEENRNPASAKKRRLFSSLEDDMIDLTIDNQE